MLARLRAQLTYANVVATLALFLALGGASYAAIRVTSGSIVNNTVRTADLRNNDIRSRDIRNRTIVARDILSNQITGLLVRESSLSKVPDSDSLDGQDSAALKAELKQKCPAGTQKALGVCIETNSRGQSTWPPARGVCSNAGGRLPTWYELDYARTTPGFGWANGDGGQYELTSDVKTVSTREVIAVDRDGFSHPGANTGDNLYYRCVIYPSN